MANGTINQQMRFFKEKRDLANEYGQYMSVLSAQMSGITIQQVNGNIVVTGMSIPAARALADRIMALVEQFNFHHRTLQEAENQQDNPITGRVLP